MGELTVVVQAGLWLAVLWAAVAAVRGGRR